MRGFGGRYYGIQLGEVVSCISMAMLGHELTRRCKQHLASNLMKMSVYDKTIRLAKNSQAEHSTNKSKQLA